MLITKSSDVYKKAKYVILTVLLLILGFVNIFPFLFMISSSFKPLGKIFEYPMRLIPDNIYLGNYIEIFSRESDFSIWYGNTIVLEVVTLLCKTFIVTITAYAFARLRFRGRDAIFLFLLSALMLPVDATLVQKYVIFKALHLTDTMWVLVVSYTFDVYFLFLMRQFFVTIPFELSEAAIIDGCNHFKVFYRIVLPLAKPGLVTMLLFTFVSVWNDFTGPFIFITNIKKQMLTVGLQMFQVKRITNYAMQMAGASLGLLPIILVFLFSQKYYIQGIVTTGIKG
jgi:multiple sugar transport system permease protein